MSMLMRSLRLLGLGSPFSETVPVRCGDQHNFGKSTSDFGSYLFKHRMGTWEHMLLSGKSRIRRKLTKSLLDLGTFSAIPDLQFDASGQRLAGFVGYSVEKLKWEPLEISTLTNENFVQVGSVIAIAVFFGMTDLHRENFIIGREQNGRFVCGPIDIETLFNRIKVIGETSLVPQSYTTDCLREKTCALHQFIGGLDADNMVRILFGFTETINRLRSISYSIDEELEKLSSSVPVRVLVKNTIEYTDFLNGAPTDSEFSECETQQLARGDVPYYFRDFRSHSLMYFVSPEKIAPACSEISKAFQKESFFYSFSERLLDFTSHITAASCFQIVKGLLKQTTVNEKTSYKNVELLVDNGKYSISFDGKLFQLKD